MTKAERDYRTHQCEYMLSQERKEKFGDEDIFHSAGQWHYERFGEQGECGVDADFVHGIKFCPFCGIALN